MSKTPKGMLFSPAEAWHDAKEKAARGRLFCRFARCGRGKIRKTAGCLKLGLAKADS